MRTIVTQGYTITYPENIIWLYDINKIRLEGSTAGYNAKITIQSQAGDTSTLDYTTRTKSITFILDDNLKFLYSGNSGSWSFTVEIDGTQIFSFACRVINGKSFLNKSHGSSNVIYHYNTDTTYDNRFIEIYSPIDGRVTYATSSFTVYEGWNTVYLPSIDITQPGDYTISLTNRWQTSINASVTSDRGISPTTSEISWSYDITSNHTTVEGGTLYGRRTIFPQSIRLHFIDPCEGDVILRYVNNDGCIRQIAGKLIEEKDAFEPTRLSNVIRSERYRYNPTFTNNSNSKTIKIGLYEVEAGAEINDIIFSDTLQILGVDNEWRDCVLKTNSVTNFKNGGFDNLEFEIIISEL